MGAVSILGPPCWKVYVDGTAKQRGFEVGLVLESLEKTIIEKSLRFGFSTTNNVRKSSKDVLGFETGGRPGEGRVRGQGCEDARVP